MSALRQLRSLPSASRFRLGISAVSSIGNGLVLPFLVVYLHDAVGLSTPGRRVPAERYLGGRDRGRPGGRFRRRPVRAATAAATNLTVAAVGVASYAFVQNTTGAVVAAFLVGLGVGGNAAFMAVLADVTPAHQHQSVFGFNAAVVNAGIAIGGVLGGFAVHADDIWSFRILYLADAVTYVIAAICMAVLSVRLRQQTRAVSADPVAEPPVSYRTVVRERRFVVLLILVVLLYFIGYGQLSPASPPSSSPRRRSAAAAWRPCSC